MFRSSLRLRFAALAAFPRRAPPLRPAFAPCRFYSDLGPREADDVDLVIVGAGPAGLAAAIKYKQMDTEGSKRVVVLEKASDLGAHTLSGAVLEPRALDELFPDWRDGEAPLYTTLATKDEMKYLLPGGSALSVPEPSQMHNKGKNYIVSLSQFVRWLGEKAEELEVEVYPGFSVSELLIEDDKVVGIATQDQGLDKSGQPKDTFERGMEFRAPITLLAEGCHGSLSKQMIKKYDLRANSDPQTYGIGLKEVWEVTPENFEKGKVAHTMGFPLSADVYGGGFQYHFGDNLVSLGLVVGLDYANPYISPYEEFQKMKTHPYYESVLKGGKCIAYGARALNEGGYQSIPQLNFPGGGLIGCSAGFVNVPKIKGTHTAMKSGMIAAELAFSGQFDQYDQAVRDSWVGKELFEVRNVRPSFNTPLKALGGLAYSGLDTMILKGRTPWTFHTKHTDAEATQPADKFKPINYPKHDNEITFDLLTNVSRTGTYHDDNEMCHLRVPDQDTSEHAEKAWPTYRGIEQRFCPAGVYEYLPESETAPGSNIPKFKINSQNCIHCKTCDIKVPTQDINWTTPEGGDGPKYTVT